VNFPSGSSEIPAADMPMLLERLATIQTTASRVAEWVEVHLYVAGYTDTVGASGDNQRLSEARARSLARFMREQGWAGPTFFQGFGEDVLEVDTADGVDEPRNRRAIFLLGTETRPGVRDMPRTSWQRLP
jgi:outer membrane protein OmpA-like peptidoglycan-associated protein